MGEDWGLGGKGEGDQVQTVSYRISHGDVMYNTGTIVHNITMSGVRWLLDLPCNIMLVSCVQHGD